MEAKLLEYRKKKEKEQKSQNSFIRNLFSANRVEHLSSPSKPIDQEVNSKKNQENFRQTDDTDSAEVSSDKKSSLSCSTDLIWKSRLLLCLYVVLWLVLWKFFIEIQFGAVYFILSVSYICYKNTQTGPRDPTKLSAYSVFNANQERLDGTFTTEQFEKELRFGATSVK